MTNTEKQRLADTERELQEWRVLYYKTLTRAEEAEKDRDRLQHIIDCADTPLMADVLRERDMWKRMAEGRME